MGSMLHVVNGDATLALLKQSTVKGTFLVWKDMLMEGPVAEKGGELDLKARAAFLQANYGADPAKYQSEMKALFAAIEKTARGKDEVVFWFEEDFFCQIHLVYLLAHLPTGLKAKGRAWVICPEKPLGVRLPSAFAKLLDGRLPLEPALLTLAAKVWKAYSSSSTEGWEAFLKWAQSGDGFAPWPLLKSGLRAHLGRLPTVNGSLSAMETALLRSLSDGPLDFAHFARRVWSEPMVRPLGLGDMQIARYALDLASRARPLLYIEGSESSPGPGQGIHPGDWKLHLTDAGQARFAELPGSPKGNGKVTGAAKGGAPKAKAGSAKSGKPAKPKAAKPAKPAKSGKGGKDVKPKAANPVKAAKPKWGKPDKSSKPVKRSKAPAKRR